MHDDLAKVLAQTEQTIAHGDYSRIARLSQDIWEKGYTPDYVHKVAKGIRENKELVKLMVVYYQEKARMEQRIQKRMKAKGG